MSDWIPYGKTFRSFLAEGLNNPGVELRIRPPTGSVSSFLLGDVNSLGGGCSCCADIEHQDIVSDYRIVWEKEKS